jgi:hypothetical protein
MKKISLLMMTFVLLMGCAVSPARIPDGKTEADWQFDNRCCLVKSGKVEGYLLTDPVDLALNVERDKAYKACLRELGWIK